MKNNAPSYSPEVMVRAWGDEPVRLLLHHIDNTTTYVCSRRSGLAIGLPSEQVFVFDSDLFSIMRPLWEAGQTDQLRKLYGKLSVDDLACNKYQDGVKCPHDQEDIADSQGTAVSGGQ